MTKKLTPAELKSRKAQRERKLDMRQRGQRSAGGPQSKSPDKVDLLSYSSIASGLKFIAVQTAAGKMKPWQVNVLTAIYKAAGLNLKMKIQRAGNWVEKSERKHEVDVSDKLAACLLKVQGSSPAELKKMKGTVDKIVGGLRK